MKSILLIFLLITGSGCAQKQLQHLVNKPNIILIMADDLGYEAIGVYGNQDYKTPNLDRLANEGMRFDYCYSTPLCTPSRVQIMTGKYNFRNYIGFGLLDPKEATFADYLADVGYKNLVVGKWQLLGNVRQQELAGGKLGTLPEQAGFHDYCLWQIDALGSRYKNPTLSSKADGGKSKKYEGYGPDIFVDYMEGFIEENKQSPFFVYYPMVLTHDPFVPTPDDANYNEYNEGDNLVYFDSMVNYMDKLVGRIVEKLDKENIRENTLILFVGDNGTSKKITSIQHDQQIQGNKGKTTDAGTHVPLIANWRGTISEGEVNNNLIDFTDFSPTLLQATNAPLKDVETDGISFYPQLIGKPYISRDWVFCDYKPNWGNFKQKKYIHDKTWKLYENGEFYNILKDKQEKHSLNIKNQSLAVQERAKEFKAILKEYQ